MKNSSHLGMVVASLAMFAPDTGGNKGGTMVVENAPAKITDAEFILANQKRWDDLQTAIGNGKEIKHESEDGQFLHNFKNARNREDGKVEKANIAKAKKFETRFRGEVRAKSPLALVVLKGIAKTVEFAKADKKEFNTNYNRMVRETVSAITPQMIREAADEAIEQLAELSALANTRQAAIAGDALEIKGTKGGKFASVLDRIASL